MKGEVYKKKGGYKRRVARSRFGCCCPHKETWQSTQNIYYTFRSRSKHV